MTPALKAISVLGIVAFLYLFSMSGPNQYPLGTVVHIESGSSVGEAATLLAEQHAIRSEFVFKSLVRVLGTRGVQAGSYALVDRQSVVTLAFRFARGHTGLEPLSITIPEGSTVNDIAILLEKFLGDFEKEKFLTLATGKEGYLFPDTYHFLPGTPPAAIIERMEQNYEEKVAPMRGAIVASGHTEAEIIIMASLLEKEARKLETMKVISGILWKRIEIGMPLQVDAVFGYIFGKPTYNPTLDDLKVSSPYNTYTNRGLPPGPIANPGIDSITAALEPTATPYLYYLTGSDGFMYYGKTFEAHVANRKHLR